MKFKVKVTCLIKEAAFTAEDLLRIDFNGSVSAFERLTTDEIETKVVKVNAKNELEAANIAREVFAEQFIAIKSIKPVKLASFLGRS